MRAQQWNLDMVEADAAHATLTGEGAVIAVIDTGAQASHPDLAGRLEPGFDFVADDDEPEDENGHGTHVAGIAVANVGNGEGVGSVAPGAKVLVIRILDEDGGGSGEDLVRAIDLAIERRVDVINLSLSEQVPLSAIGLTDEAADAVVRAARAGIVVAAAAGNNSLPLCENVTDGGRILCVGAVDRRGSRSAFSSFGAGLSLVAPGGSGAPVRGEDVLSTYYRSQYEEIAGTSQAAPHVAGVAALLVEAGIRGQDAVARILATARDAGLPGRDLFYGAGIVNARRAVEGLRPSGGNGGGEGGSGGDGGGGGGTGRGATASTRRVQRIGTVLRQGLKVRCRLPAAGACRVTVSVAGRRVASGSNRLEAAGSATAVARVSRSGRRTLRRARNGSRARVVVRLGSATRTLRVTLRR